MHLIHDVKIILRVDSTSDIELQEYIEQISLNIDESSFSDTVEISFIDDTYYDLMNEYRLDGNERIWLRMRSYIEGDTPPAYWEFRFLIEEVSGKNDIRSGAYSIWGRAKLARLDNPYTITITDKTDEEIEAGATPYVWQSSELIFAHDIVQEMIDTSNDYWGSSGLISLLDVMYDSTSTENFFKESFPVYPGTFSVSNSTPLQVIANVCDIIGFRIRNSHDQPDATSSDPDVFGNLFIKEINAGCANNNRDWDNIIVSPDAMLFDYNYIESIDFDESANTGYNNLLITGVEETGADLDHSIDLEIECGESSFDYGEEGYIRAYISPFIRADMDLQEAFDERFEYCLTSQTDTTAEITSFLLLTLEEEEIEEEEIVINDGVGTLARPAKELTGRYFGKDLGDYTYSDGYKLVTTEHPYCGVFIASYKTEFLRFRYICQSPAGEENECHKVFLELSEKETYLE